MGAVSDRGIRFCDWFSGIARVGDSRLALPDTHRHGRDVRSGLLDCLPQTAASTLDGRQRRNSELEGRSVLT